MAPRPLWIAALMVPQPSKVFPAEMVMVEAPMEPEARTETRWPEVMESRARWIAVM
jgi:hypothetical protein